MIADDEMLFETLVLLTALLILQPGVLRQIIGGGGLAVGY